MKTLNKQITSAFFKEPDGYQRLTALWSALMQDRALRKELGCAHHLLYAILRGKNWQKGLTPISNVVKLTNGAAYGWVGRRAIRILHGNLFRQAFLAPFADVLADDALDRIRLLVPDVRWDEDPMAREPYAL
jgi:hypothetical protein